MENPKMSIEEQFEKLIDWELNKQLYWAVLFITANLGLLGLLETSPVKDWIIVISIFIIIGIIPICLYRLADTVVKIRHFEERLRELSNLYKEELNVEQAHPLKLLYELVAKKTDKTDFSLRKRAVLPIIVAVSTLWLLLLFMVANIVIVMEPVWDFWISFSSGVLATLIGVIVGIPIAFLIDRRIRERRQNEDSFSILSALKDEISHNIGLLEQMQKELPTTVIFYNLDLSVWEATSSKMLDTIRNKELVRQISSVYYEYQHLSRKVDVQFHMHYSSMLALTGYGTVRQSIVQPIIDHASILTKRSNELLIAIEKELSKLKN